jgi:hypothetical protein
MLRLLNRDEQRKPEQYELFSPLKIQRYELVVRLSGQREVPEVSSVLLKSIIRKMIMKRWEEKFSECGNEKTAARKMRRRQPLALLACAFVDNPTFRWKATTYLPCGSVAKVAIRLIP